MTQLRAALGPASSALTTAPSAARKGRGRPGAADGTRASPAGSPGSEPGWETVALDDLTAASDLLDCLENRGVREVELVVLGERQFVVRWRPS